MAIGKSKQKTTSSGTTGPDARTQGRIDQIWNAAERAGGQVPTAIGGAQNYYTGLTGAGQAGIDALSGDAAAAQRFMNPYVTNVIDQLNKQFEVGNQMTMRQTNDAATRAGAFGGSRAAIAQGVALGENARNRDAQVASLLSSGFDNAMGRAAGVAGMGFDAAGAGANLGMTAGSPDLWRLSALRRGFDGLPYGQVSTSRGNTSGWGWQFDPTSMARKAAMPSSGSTSAW